MDAPKGRYRVEEKDGRLTVIDTATGAPATSVTPPHAPRPPGAPGTIERPTGLIDRYGRLLLSLAVRRWDEKGRALVRWEWEQNGKARRWHAALGSAEQRKFGRALAAVTVFPIFVLLTIFGGPGFWLLPIAFPLTAWGVWAIGRLQRETDPGGGSGG